MKLSSKLTYVLFAFIRKSLVLKGWKALCKNFNLQSSVHIFLRISLQMYFGILEWSTKYGCLLNDVNLNEAFDDQRGLYRNEVSSAVALTWEGRKGKLKFNFCVLFSFWTRVRAINMWQNCAFRRLVLLTNLNHLNCNLKVLLIAWSFPRFFCLSFEIIGVSEI